MSSNSIGDEIQAPPPERENLSGLWTYCDRLLSVLKKNIEKDPSSSAGYFGSICFIVGFAMMGTMVHEDLHAGQNSPLPCNPNEQIANSIKWGISLALQAVGSGFLIAATLIPPPARVISSTATNNVAARAK